MSRVRADAGGDQQAGRPGGGRRAEVGVGELEVVERRAPGSAASTARAAASTAAAPPAPAARPGAQRGRDRGGGGPLLGVEVAVAAGQRQAVGLAHGRDADDLDAERELARHRRGSG